MLYKRDACVELGRLGEKTSAPVHIRHDQNRIERQRMEWNIDLSPRQLPAAR